MSRGHGRIEREVLGFMRDLLHARTDVEVLRDNIPGASEPAIRRALRSLARKGCVEPWPSAWSRRKLWALIETEQEGEQRRKRRKRKIEQAFGKPKGLSSGDREKLAKVLGMLGSAHEGERQAAVRAADELQRKTGRTWREILFE
jgi:hypothetical protein